MLDLGREKSNDIVLNEFSTAQGDSNVLMFSVVYNQSETSDIKRTAISGFDRQSKTLLEGTLHGPGTSKTSPKKIEEEHHHVQSTEPETNYVKVDIDVHQLKRFAPELDFNSPEDLKKVSDQLAQAISLSPTGELLIDSSKLDPSSVRLREKNLAIKEEPSASSDIQKMQKSSSKDERSLPGKRTVLMKGSKNTALGTFLIIISSVEKLALGTAMSVEAKNQVVQEYDLYLEVSAVEVPNHKKNPPIIWQLSLAEAESITDLEDPNQIARFLMKRIQVLGDRFLLVVPKKLHMTYKTAAIIGEKILRMIQTQFRSRALNNNIKNYKKKLAALKSKIICQTFVRIQELPFIVVCVKGERDACEIIAWYTDTFQEFQTEIKGEKLRNLSQSEQIAFLKNCIMNLKFIRDAKGNFAIVLPN